MFSHFDLKADLRVFYVFYLPMWCIIVVWCESITQRKETPRPLVLVPVILPAPTHVVGAQRRTWFWHQNTRQT